MNKFIPTLILFFVAIGLIGFYFYKQEPKKENVESVNSIINIGSEDVLSIEVAGFKIEKAGNDYKLGNEKLNKDKVLVYIDKILNLSYSKQIEVNDEKDYSLDNPVFEIKINDKRLYFGSETPVSNRVYVGFEGNYYLVDKSSFEDLKIDENSFK